MAKICDSLTVGVNNYQIFKHSPRGNPKMRFLHRGDIVHLLSEQNVSNNGILSKGRYQNAIFSLYT